MIRILVLVIFLTPTLGFAAETKISSGKALIVITSEPLQGNSAEIQINGKRVAAVDQDQSYKGEILAGKTVIAVKGSELVIDVRPDHEYRLEVSMGASDAGATFMFGMIGAAASASYKIALKNTIKPQAAETAPASTPEAPAPRVATSVKTTGQVSRTSDMQAAQRLVMDDPSNAAGWREVGGHYQNAGEYEKAIRAHEQAVRLEPSNVDGLELLGSAYAKAGRKDKVKEVWERLGQIDKSRAERFFSSHMLP